MTDEEIRARIAKAVGLEADAPVEKILDAIAALQKEVDRARYWESVARKTLVKLAESEHKLSSAYRAAPRRHRGMRMQAHRASESHYRRIKLAIDARLAVHERGSLATS